MRQVYTYRSIAALENHPRFNEIVRCPQITATGDLLKAMKQRYPQITALEDIHAIQKGLITDWESPDIAFQQFVNISRVIRTLPVEAGEETIHGSFIKNKIPVLNAIRLLVEANVTPEDLIPTNIEEKIFKQVWEKLELEDYSFVDLRVGLDDYLENPNAFRSALRHVAPSMAAGTVILHGFYFITPIQERLFDMMERCGIRLIFLCVKAYL